MDEAPTKKMTEQQAVRALERFVVENDDLIELETRIGRFNIFDALGIVNAEIRHSNFLAWLLDPNESHGAGSIFLRAVLMDILRQAEPENRPLSPIDLDGDDLGQVEVRREWRNIDLLILLEDQKVAVVIENKVLSGEHSGQLGRYQKIVESELRGFRPFYVFLTPEGEDASESSWCSYSYADVHRALSRCRKLYEDSIGDEVGVFLDQYLSLIGSRFMQSEEIERLIDRIYKNHRQAIDLIFERRSDPRQSLIRSIVEMLEQDDESWIIDATLSGLVRFRPQLWTEILPPINGDRHGDERGWVYARFLLRKRALSFAVHIGSTTEEGPRDRLIRSIEAGRSDVFKVARRGGEDRRRCMIYGGRLLKDSNGIKDGKRTRQAIEDAFQSFKRDLPAMHHHLRGTLT